MQKGVGAIGVILIIGTLGAVAALGWYVYGRSESSNEVPVTTTEDTGTTESEIANEKNIPDDWARYEDDAKKLSFYYPESWDKDSFEVQSAVVTDYMLAPLGGAGGGLRFKLNGNKSAWEVFEPSGQGYILSASDLLQSSNSTIGSYPVGFGKISEGGAVTHFILFTDGNRAYQIRLPIISESQATTPKSYIELKEEQNDSLDQIIKSVELL